MILGRSYTTTITCIENGSEGYLMRRDEFLRLFLANEVAWAIMFEDVKIREAQYDQYCLNFVSVTNEDKLKRGVMLLDSDCTKNRAIKKFQHSSAQEVDQRKNIIKFAPIYNSEKKGLEPIIETTHQPITRLKRQVSPMETNPLLKGHLIKNVGERW